jgi:hypothetical protein
LAIANSLAEEEDLGVNDVQFEEPSYVGYLDEVGVMCVLDTISDGDAILSMMTPRHFEMLRNCHQPL